MASLDQDFPHGIFDMVLPYVGHTNIHREMKLHF